MQLDSPKIFQSGEVTIGISGDVRAADILRYQWKAPNVGKLLIEEYLGKKLIPSMINAFNENSYDWNNNTGKDKDDKPTFGYLVAVRGQVFEIGNDMDIGHKINGLYAAGTGCDFALGCLHSIDFKFYKYLITSITAAEKAMRIACELDINTGLPIQLVYKTANDR